MRKRGDTKSVSPAVELDSKELQKELDKAEAPTDILSWANKVPKEAPADPAFAGIVETIIVKDPRGTYDRLEQALRVGDNRTDYGSVMKALDEAETNAREAHKLWMSAIVERKRWEMDNDVVFGAMRKEAEGALQREKESGHRNKMITDADVDSRVSILYPDQWRAQELRRIKMKVMVDSMQNLNDLWQSRCRSLQTILSKQR